VISIDPARTALLVMDFQNDLVDPEGTFGSQGAAEVERKHAIENTAQALAAARRERVTVVHVGLAWREGHPEINPAAPLFSGAPPAGGLVEGTWGAEFHPALRPADAELVVRKRGVSALAGTELERFLRLRGLRTLVLSGFATNFVVEGTAREAVDRGYEVVVLADCCASYSAEMDDFALQAILPLLGTVTSCGEFIEALTEVPSSLVEA
jgi:ureidoacrylate peracid hydrolase